MTTDTEEDIDELDREALALAMKIACLDPMRREQIDSKLLDEPWHEVAAFASYLCQCRNLKLKPWEEPPCAVDEDAAEDSPARTLLRRMLAAGVSRYHPDPMAALAGLSVRFRGR